MLYLPLSDVRYKFNLESLKDVSEYTSQNGINGLLVVVRFFREGRKYEFSIVMECVA